MATMADAVTWTDIPAGQEAVAGYVDGPRSAWPEEAWAHFAGHPGLRCSVLANPDADCFDLEAGDAGAEAVALACALRVNRGLPSVVYTNGSTIPNLVTALRMKSVPLLPAYSWPGPGAFLWCASPELEPGRSPAWAPVEPVAVQNRFLDTYDLSTLTGSWLPPALPEVAPAPVPVPAPPPVPAPEPVHPAAPGSVAVTVPWLAYSPGGPMPSGEWVRVVQWRVGAKVDGLYGPLTKDAVEAFQRAKTIGVDGIVGPVTAARVANG